MKKRTLTILLLVTALSLAAAYTAATAQMGQASVVIHPLRWDSSQTVYSDEEIIFVMGWGACRKGLVQSYLTAVNMVFTLDGEALFSSKADANQYWGSITEIPAPPAADACVGKMPETIWRAPWAYSYGTLEAGDHIVYFAHQLNHPVIDGGDYDGDGHPDLFKGVVNAREFTVHVEDPPGE